MFSVLLSKYKTKAFVRDRHGDIVTHKTDTQTEHAGDRFTRQPLAGTD